MYLQVPAFSSDPCSTVTLINSIASQSCSSQLQKLDKATNIDAKCGYVIYRVSLYRVSRCTKTIQLVFVAFLPSMHH